MAVWALADPHLSFGVPNKAMDPFGPEWKNHPEKIAAAWKERVGAEDLVLVAGDISWAMRTEEVIPDLLWLDALPGTKLIIRGNHDYWWSSASKLIKIMPPSIHFIHNSVFNWKGISIGGSRLWDSEEYNFNSFIHFRENPLEKSKKNEKKEDLRIFDRELERLRLSLQGLDPKAHTRIAMTHYPPIGADLSASRASKILEEFQIDLAVFGHLHSLDKTKSLFGEARGVRYLLTSCDYLNFIPLHIV